MSQYPNSPHGQAQQAVAEFHQGTLGRLEFLQRIEALVRSVDAWKSQLDAIPSDDYEEGQELIADAREALEAVDEGADLLREFAESRAAETAEEGLALLAEASDFLAQLLDITEQNMADLEDLG
jgi:hypothetical protein